MSLKIAKSVKAMNMVPDTCLMSLIKVRGYKKEEVMEEEKRVEVVVVIVVVVLLGSKLTSGHQGDRTSSKECGRGNKSDSALFFLLNSLDISGISANRPTSPPITLATVPAAPSKRLNGIRAIWPEVMLQPPDPPSAVVGGRVASSVCLCPLSRNLCLCHMA